MQSDIFEAWVRGRTCVSCAVLKKDVFGFVLSWSRTEDIEASDVADFYLVHYLSDDAEAGRDFGVKFYGDSRRRLAVNHAAAELLVVAAGGNLFAQNQYGGKSEKMLSRDQIIGSHAVRFIGGHFYVAGDIRCVLRRDGPEQWKDMTPELRIDAPEEGDFDLGFRDIDGFDETDMYAVGGNGDVCRFDGQNWKVIDIPTNAQLLSVCCASDGNVYIGGVGHLIMRGREDQWDILNERETNDRFQQIIEFKGRLFTVDEWGSRLYEITQEGVVQVDMGDFSLPPTACLCMAVGHDMLLIAGLESASSFDGQTWHALFRSEDAEDVMLMQELLEDSKKTLDQLTTKLEAGED